MNGSTNLTPGGRAASGGRVGGRRAFSMRGLALGLGAALMAAAMTAGTALAAPGGPWQQQSTTCLIGPHLDPGHVYVNVNTGKTTCKRD